MPSDSNDKHQEYRNKLLGLGESSLRKNYYPELRKRMKELEESRTRYKTIFNATADALFIHDSQTHKIIDFNECVCDMFGYTNEEMKRVAFAELCGGTHPYTLECAKDYICKATKSGLEHFEWKCRRKDDSFFWTDIILKKATIGTQECIVASVRDITAKKNLEEQLLHSQKMEAMGQLAGGVAHDFNNMLSSITGAAEVIQVIATGDGRVKKLTDIILKAADTAGNLTKQLLSFSRKETSEQHPISIHQALKNAEEILQRSFARNIHFNITFGADNDIISGDLSLIENIIINLSINARDAMQDGGKLTIKTDNRMLNDTQVPSGSEASPNGYICIVVSDTGAGMSEEVRLRIFEPFFTTKETGKGTGLGLAAVYATVQKHRGFVEVESALGHGTTFNIFLPLVYQDVETVADDSNRTVSGTGKILVIDDDELLRYIGESMLGTLGYKVRTAEDGIEGIDIFKEFKPDLVILDMVLPNMNSTDCFHELRKLDPDLPVIAVSGFNHDSTIDDLFDEGLVGFMEKPYKIIELSKKIAAILSPAAE